MNRILKCDKYRITQKFSSSHKGIDIVGRKDDKNITCPIKAHTEGTIVFCQTGKKNNPNATGNASYGNCVKIKHSNGYYTLYAHMEKVYVKKGQKVSTGQEIGFMGNTGRSFGSHLHWEVRKPNETRINPEPYINANLPGMETKHYYQAYDNVKNKFLPKVVIGSKDYAGNIGNPISAFRTEECEEFIAHDKVKKCWLPICKSYKDYAGNLPNDIDAIAIKSSKLKYRVHLKKGNRWLDYVDGYNLKDSKNGYAGNIGESIDAIQIQYK